MAGSCTNEYQGCPLPSKNYRALTWWLVTVVNDTNLKEAYRRKPYDMSLRPVDPYDTSLRPVVCDLWSCQRRQQPTNCRVSGASKKRQQDAPSALRSAPDLSIIRACSESGLLRLWPRRDAPSAEALLVRTWLLFVVVVVVVAGAVCHVCLNFFVCV